MLKLHICLFIHKKLKLKCHKKHYKVYNTQLTYIDIFKVNLCSVLSISSSTYKHYT